MHWLHWLQIDDAVVLSLSHDSLPQGVHMWLGHSRSLQQERHIKTSASIVSEGLGSEMQRYVFLAVVGAGSQALLIA